MFSPQSTHHTHTPEDKLREKLDSGKWENSKLVVNEFKAWFAMTGYMPCIIIKDQTNGKMAMTHK